MFTAAPISPSIQNGTRVGGVPRLVLLFVVGSLAAFPCSVHAADAPTPGLTVQLPAVITEDVTARLRAAVYVPLRR